jgi:hypothetical protein
MFCCQQLVFLLLYQTILNVSAYILMDMNHTDSRSRYIGYILSVLHCEHGICTHTVTSRLSEVFPSNLTSSIPILWYSLHLAICLPSLLAAMV